jgi:hypothetical protein
MSSFECFSFFNVLATTCRDIDIESNHILREDLVLVLVFHVHEVCVLNLSLNQAVCSECSCSFPDLHVVLKCRQCYSDYCVQDMRCTQWWRFVWCCPGLDAAYSGRWVLRFQRNLLLPAQGQEYSMQKSHCRWLYSQHISCSGGHILLHIRKLCKTGDTAWTLSAIGKNITELKWWVESRKPPELLTGHAWQLLQCPCVGHWFSSWHWNKPQIHRNSGNHL